MNTSLISFVLLGVVCLLTYLLFDQCSDKQALKENAIQLRADSTVLAIKEATAQRQLSDKLAQEDRATAKALLDEQNRQSRDNLTAMMIAAMSKPQQNQTALDYLIANGFLSKQDYQGKTVAVSSDTTITRAVAVQGKVLSDTRAELSRKDTAYHQSLERESDLEGILNNRYYQLSETRTYVQDRISERGLLRGKSKKQFREVDRQLSEAQKGMLRH